MLVEWLEEAGQAGRPAGRYLVLLYLVRGRLPEALRAFGELRNSTPEAQTGASVTTPTDLSPRVLLLWRLCGSMRSIPCKAHVVKAYLHLQNWTLTRNRLLCKITARSARTQ